MRPVIAWWIVKQTSAFLLLLRHPKLPSVRVEEFRSQHSDWHERLPEYNPTVFNLRSQRNFAVTVGNIALHEQGHEFGLGHKCESGTRPLATGESADFLNEYSAGDRDWQPMMGECLNSQRTIWSQRSIQLDDRLGLLSPEMQIRINGNNEFAILNRFLGLQPNQVAQ